MDLPDCPPGAEGYQDSVTERPKKLNLEDTQSCTKAEQEFQNHLHSLKLKVEDGEVRPMVERRGRDVSGKWIYLCYPCAAVCSGENTLQTHISGKKHKNKLSMRSVWPRSIFDEHPFILGEKGIHPTNPSKPTEKVLQKMAAEVDLYNKDPNDLDAIFGKYRNARCHIQNSTDQIKAPLLGLEYLLEHPPEQPHYEPSYICVLCSKQGHPRTIVNHLTCFWHRYNYLTRHFPKACCLLSPYRGQNKYREGVNLVMNRLAQRIEDKYGRMKPTNIDKEEYEKDKERIHQWIFKSPHYNEQMGPTFEEVVDVELITALHKNEESEVKPASRALKDPSPPVVAAPSKPRPAANARAPSVDALSDISDEPPRRDNTHLHRERTHPRHNHKSRYEPYPDKRRGNSPVRSRYVIRNAPEKNANEKDKKPPNYEYKLKLAEDKRKAAEESARKTLAYHEKNPEKHPLYPEEWKKFWNRRYKEIQTEGKDPSKHDFKPEWIVFWTTRMKELHDEELRVNVNEIYRKLCLTPPDMTQRPPEPRRKSPERRRSPERPERRRSPERRHSPERLRSMDRKRSAERRRSPDMRRRSPLDHRRRSPDLRRRSPDPRRRSPERRRSSERRRTPPEYRRDRRTPEHLRRSPPRHMMHNRSRSPIPRGRSPARTYITLESARGSRSPLSRRGEVSRNRSPQAYRGPASNTIMISDDDLKNDNLSPWNSDNDIDSLGSLPDAKSPPRARSRTDSLVSSRASRPRAMPRDFHGPRGADPQDLGPAENVVATLRLLVALEDYLGSLGPKIVDLLTEALKMEKDEANSSEELLERESAVVLIETAKEKLKGAMQAGLVPHAAAAALRAAVVRAASTLHEADTRAKKKQQTAAKTVEPTRAVPVAGVGSVDRAQIAQQMAAALIAQGKTDVSSEELAQLVDAVVGMAEAKKREAEVKKKVEARALADKFSRPSPAPAKCGTASALQMLQSAYDENDKKVEKEDVPDAMDGLSDSDLETLLKNFNELSAEEQHSLIAYLKKLEAREPERVERLRQYVSAAAVQPQEEPPKAEEKNAVVIESDDDDYTVEDVFKSATQKVKEDQIRQEMEIVKKSLEESTQKSTPPTDPDTPSTSPNPVISNNISAATDLLALVQASLQSTSANAISDIPKADVVTSNTQPRSFGDVPEPSANPVETLKSLIPNIAGNQPMQGMQQQTPFNQTNRPSPNQMNFGGNRNIPPWERDNTNNMQMNNMSQDNQGPINNRGAMDNRGPTNNIECIDNRGAMDNRGPFNRGFGQDSFNQGPRGNFNNGPKQDNFEKRPPLLNQPFGNQGGNQPFGNQGGNQPFGNQGGNQPFGNQGGNKPFGNQPFGNQGGNQAFGNQPFGNQGGNQPFGNQGGNQPFGNQGGNQPFGNQGGNQPFGNQGGNQPFGNQGGNQSFGNQGGNQRFGNQGGNQRFGNPGNNFRGRGRGMRGRGRGQF